MDYQALMSELNALGTEQTRKTYKRHGITGDVYGVSFANLEKLKKQLKINHQLAEELWGSGNHDARILATMIADPSKATDSMLEEWLSDVNNTTLSDLFSTYVSKTRFAKEKVEKWISSEFELAERVGWALLARLTKLESLLSDEFFEKYLQLIEKEIHTQKNSVKQAMNNTLIAIGVVNSNLEEKALKIAAKIGKVDIDHGDTNCKTPDAAAYIKKTIAYREEKASKVKAVKAK